MNSGSESGAVATRIPQLSKDDNTQREEDHHAGADILDASMQFDGETYREGEYEQRQYEFICKRHGLEPPGYDQ